MSIDKKIKEFYKEKGLKLSKKHISQITDKEFYYNWLKGKEGPLDLYTLNSMEGIPLIKRYIRKHAKALFPHQKKLQRGILQYLKDVNIHYFQLTDQEDRISTVDSLNEYEKERWIAHTNHPLLDQKKVKDAKIVLLGVGGIGSNVLQGLVYAGITHFKIVDKDIVDLSNLNRQTLYDFHDIGKEKVKIAKKRALEINPNIYIESFNIDLNYPPDKDFFNKINPQILSDYKDINDIIKWGDIIVSGMDYNGAPYLINDLCVLHKKPFYKGDCAFSHGHIIKFYPPNDNLCLRCMYGKANFYSDSQPQRYRNKKTLDTGVLGTTVITTGAFISNMIIHDISLPEHPHPSCYILFDTFRGTITKVPLKKTARCHCNLIKMQKMP
ncbi:MAG: HesA/MoeB/ThiF family protein [Promethearchaeota archaeon]|jgi:adenylyltransferase/sulfurtransferase